MNTNKQQLIKDNDDGALLRAAEKGYVEVVDALLAVRTHEGQDAGVDVHACREMALLLASSRGHADVIKTLIKHGADIHVDGDTPLAWASEAVMSRRSKYCFLPAQIFMRVKTNPYREHQKTGVWRSCGYSWVQEQMFTQRMIKHCFWHQAAAMSKS